MNARSRAGAAGRVLGAAGLSAGLIAFGLVVSGNTARARELYVRATAPATGVEPVPGSRARPAREVLIDGVPTRVVSCEHAGRSPDSVRRSFEEQAARESISGDLHFPYMSAADRHGEGFVVWTDARTGRRRGAIVRAGARGGAEYVLIDGDSKLEPAARADRAALNGPALVGGVEAPGGACPILTVDEGRGGLALVEVPGTPSGVAARVVDALAAKGFTIDVDAARESGGRNGRMNIPFEKQGVRGLAVIAPLDGTRSRVSYMVRALD
jgi:hypothetical protein